MHQTFLVAISKIKVCCFVSHLYFRVRAKTKSRAKAVYIPLVEVFTGVERLTYML